MGQAFEVQVGAGEDEEGDVKQVVDLAQAFEELVPAGRAVGQGDAEGEAGQQRIDAEVVAEGRAADDPAEEQDLLLAGQFQALGPEREQKTDRATDDERPGHAHSEEPKGLLGTDQQVGEDGETEDRNQVVEADQGEDGAGDRAVGLIFPNHHQGRCRRGGDGDDAEKQGEGQRGGGEVVSRQDPVQPKEVGGQGRCGDENEGEEDFAGGKDQDPVPPAAQLFQLEQPADVHQDQGETDIGKGAQFPQGEAADQRRQAGEVGEGGSQHQADQQVAGHPRHVTQ